jgi:hypothetical protein
LGLFLSCPSTVTIYKVKQCEKVIVPMVETIANHPQEKKKVLRGRSAGLALETSIGQFLHPGVTTLFTSSHGKTIMDNLVRFG